MERQDIEMSDRAATPERRRVTLTIAEVPFQVNEAVNTLRGNIQLSGFDIHVVGVTSAMKHEGKSSLAFRLAKSFAALERRALYVDCDIRNSQTIRRYGVRRRVQGLTEYLSGNAELNDIIWKTSEPCLEMIFTGAVAPNPSELFSGELFRKMLAELRDRFDYVIVDTPPVNAVIDGVLIAKECDGTVLIVESGITDRVQAQRAKQQLDYAGVKLLGVVLNKLGTRKSGYRYGYGSGYGYGYGENGEKRWKRRKKG